MFGLFKKKKRRLCSDYCLAYVLDSWKYDKLRDALPEEFSINGGKLLYGDDRIEIFRTSDSGINYTAQEWARPLINEAKIALEIYGQEREAYKEEEERIYKTKEDKLKKIIANRD